LWYSLFPGVTYFFPQLSEFFITLSRLLNALAPVPS
jgi:hypothetical protein